MNFNMLKKGDLILIGVLVVLILASAAWMSFIRSGNTSKIAVVKQDNIVIKKIDLEKVKEQERIKIDGQYTETILVENGRIRFEEADCPDQVCVRTGWLSERGDNAACVPNHAVIVIEGESPSVDSVTY